MDAIHSGALAAAEYDSMPTFNLAVPRAVAGVPTELLMPRSAWADAEAYDATLHSLGELFRANFKKYEDGGGFVTPEQAHEILRAGPTAAA